MEKLLMSAVNPVRNCAKYVSLAVNSALLQNVPPEVLALDDKSKDNLDQVMNRHQNDPRVFFSKTKSIWVLPSPVTGGVSLAKGDYLAFLDADDYWLPNKIKRQLALMQLTG